MPRATIALLFNSHNQVLLWMKKRGFWAGKRNGFGGKPHGEETPAQTAARELEEESGVLVTSENLTHLGLLHFSFEDKSERDQDVYVFKGEYNGDFQETEEMLTQWRDLDKIPYDQMREDDKFRMHHVIQNEKFEMTFRFDKDGKLIEK